MATIPCSVIEYVHYSRAIEEKKYCIVLGAIEVHDSLTHCISPFSCMTHHLDARFLASLEIISIAYLHFVGNNL